MYRTAYRTATSTACPSSIARPRAGRTHDPATARISLSSRMWQPLLDRLADTFHLVAPDYPGFGHSDAPGHMEFAYTFDHLAAVIGRFTEVLGLGHYTLVMQDYGGPVGFRLAIAHPERLEALIVQNAVAHEDGLGEGQQPPPDSAVASRVISRRKIALLISGSGRMGSWRQGPSSPERQANGPQLKACHP